MVAQMFQFSRTREGIQGPTESFVDSLLVASARLHLVFSLNTAAKVPVLHVDVGASLSWWMFVLGCEAELA